jgi:hypothetical protein
MQHLARRRRCQAHRHGASSARRQAGSTGKALSNASLDGHALEGFKCRMREPLGLGLLTIHVWLSAALMLHLRDYPEDSGCAWDYCNHNERRGGTVWCSPGRKHP